MAEGQLLESLGLSVIELNLPAVVGEILPDGAAEKSGLLNHDEIISVDGFPIKTWGEWVELIRNSPGKKLRLEVLREDNIVVIDVTPDSIGSQGKKTGRIGAAAFAPEGLFDSYFVIES